MAAARLSRRFGFAALNLLAVLQVGVLLFYFIQSVLFESDWWFVGVLGFMLPWLFLPLLVLIPLAVWARRPLVLVSVGVSGLLFLATYGALFTPAPAPQTDGPPFTLMSYNVLYASDQADPILAEIARYDADILGLQEFLPPKAGALQSRLAPSYPYRYVGESFALFSRFPLENCRVLRQTGRVSGWIQRCDLLISDRRIALYQVHARPPHTVSGLRFGLSTPLLVDLERAQNRSDLQALFPYLQTEAGPVLVFGDFNQTDRDPQVQALSRTMTDAFRARGWGFGFTFSRFGVPVWRIDYVFHSAELVTRRATTGAFSGSDHRPLIVELGFSAP